MSATSHDDALSSLSDAALVAHVAERVAVPREAEADSFVLHAPLEVLARAALLPYVSPAPRTLARQRIAEVASSFDAHEPAVFASRARTFAGTDDALAYLAEAMRAGDLDGADAAADWLGTALSATQLSRALADSVMGSLAAAAHAPIYLWLAPRVNPRGTLTGRLLRPLVRELTRESSMVLRWIDARGGASRATREVMDAQKTGAVADAQSTRTESTAAYGAAAAMTAALASTPRLGEGTSNFIFPTMARVDVAELAPAILGPVCGHGPIADRGRAVLRVAAWSMLGEPTTHAPYGWSHALTMAQAAIGIAPGCVDESRALATAATFVMGFRASLAVRPIIETFEGESIDAASIERASVERASVETGDVDSLSASLAAGADAAAAAAWRYPRERRAELVTALASRAATHPDAHQAKYTLACLDAAGDDPQYARLYLTAAAKLVGHWAAQPTPAGH